MKTVNYREYRKALNELRTELRVQAGECHVELFEMNTDCQPVQLGINWAGIGTVNTDAARDFAAAIATAAARAESFISNGSRVEY